MIKIIKTCFIFLLISGFIRYESYAQVNSALAIIAAQEVISAAASMKLSQKPNLNFKIDTNLVKQSYKIEESLKQTYTITDGDELGLMYGGIELAELIKIGKSIPVIKEPIIGKPYIKERGLKFNVILDNCNPSYQDVGGIVQNNILEMWQQKELGTFTDKFYVEIAAHRDRLNRISPINM